MSDIVKLSPFDESRVAKEGTQKFRENAAYSWAWMVDHVKEVNLLINDLNQYRGNLKSIIANYLIEALDENGINKEILELDKVDNTRDIDKPISTETKNYVDAITPRGIIVMWSGAVNTIPTGWALCDGTNGTPDLRNKFIIGSSIDSGGQSVTTITGGATKDGGSKDAVVVAHTHSGSTSSGGEHNHSSDVPLGEYSNGANGYGGLFGYNPTTKRYTNNAGAHSHSLNINNSGESGIDKNLPPYYALAFIMKL